tara:strand:+ start:34267 stop:34749 length:483 start_codon:yes stop_codon:yes gene_type:complete
MTRFLSGLAAVTIALTLTTGAMAQTGDETARRALADQIAVISSSEDDYGRALAVTMPGVRQMFEASVPGATEAQLDDVVLVMTDILMSTYGDVLDAMAETYAERFTLTELEALLEFYQTDLGQKVLRETPAIMEIMGARGEELGQAAVTREMAQIQAVFE